MLKRRISLAVASCLLMVPSACGAAQAGEPAAAAAPHGAHAAAGAVPQGMRGHDHGGHQGEDASAAVKAVFVFPGGPPAAGERTKLRIEVTGADGTPVETFAVSHEKLMHLIVVSRDLSRFGHVHPGYEGSGVFTAVLDFPAAGRYKLFADFVPEGGAERTASEWVEVTGAEAPAIPLVPDTELVKKADGTIVELKPDGAAAGGDVTLTFTLRDAATGKPADGMEPYLGASGHVVVLSADAESYLHVHPAEDAAPGPEAVFRTTFPAPGLYKIWGQFRRNGELLTVAYVVDGATFRGFSASGRGNKR